MPDLELINFVVTDVCGILFSTKFIPKFPLNVSEYSLWELRYSSHHIIPTYLRQMNLERTQNRPTNSTPIP